MQKSHLFMCAAVIAAASSAAPASAQRGAGAGWGPGWEPGMMMGPGPMWGPSVRGTGRFSHMCDPRMAGFAPYQLTRIERTITPTDAQQTLIEDLKKASAKAADIMRAACPDSAPPTPPARLEFMEKRAQAMYEAIKTVRGPYEAFYASLTDEQKSSLNRINPPQTWWHRFWRGS